MSDEIHRRIRGAAGAATYAGPPVEWVPCLDASIIPESEGLQVKRSPFP